MIVGLDEVGRGALAGPLVIGAVLLGGAQITGLTDSKKLTKRQRELLDKEIRLQAKAIGLGWVSAGFIDKYGLPAALRAASRRALQHIRHDYTEVIIDGTVAFVDDPRVNVMKKADLLVPAVSAASIIAKVARDNYMALVDQIYPGYGFAGHVGYGTSRHMKAVGELGPTPLHRLSFAPLCVQAAPSGVTLIQPKTTKTIGNTAETVVADYLARHGHVILARNWRTKLCEIDIVSIYGDTLYFTEVKYRKTDLQGGGLAAITGKKQRQMKFAAELFVLKNRAVADKNPRLAVADVCGVPPAVINFLEIS